MKRNILIALLGLIVTGQLVFAQQANQNINVLPLPADPLALNAHLLGDVYLQRQVEPTIVASTRNPDHLMAFFVDYRAVDIADDPRYGGVAERGAVLRGQREKLLHQTLQALDERCD